METGSGIGRRARQIRKAKGKSLAVIAGLAGISASHLSNLELGRRNLDRAALVDALAAALDVAPAELTGVPAGDVDVAQVALAWLVDDSPVRLHLRAGRRIGESLTDELAEQVVGLRHADDVTSSVDLLPAVARALAETDRLAQTASYSEPVGIALFTIVGELAQLAGWVASDVGKYADAQRFYLGGFEAARTIGDRALAGQLLSSLSYQVANTGRPRDALTLARAAETGATTATPLVRSLLAERVAWAAARSRDPEATVRALDAADTAYAAASPGVAEPEWTYWLNRAEIDVMAARCRIELGQPADATPLLTRALASYPTEHARETALYLSWLAEGYARAQELDAAREAADQARDYAVRSRSPRAEQRIRAVDTLIRAGSQGSP